MKISQTKIEKSNFELVLAFKIIVRYIQKIEAKKTKQQVNSSKT